MHGQMDREGVLNFCVSGVAAPQHFYCDFRMVFVFNHDGYESSTDGPFGTWSLIWVSVLESCHVCVLLALKQGKSRWVVTWISTVLENRLHEKASLDYVHMSHMERCS
jgi:hypothetical protein